MEALIKNRIMHCTLAVGGRGGGAQASKGGAKGGGCRGVQGE